MTFKEFCKELLEEYGYIIFQYDSVISFTQTFPDTTCGLGGIGGQAFTDAQIFIFVNQSNRKKKIPTCRDTMVSSWLDVCYL